MIAKSQQHANKIYVRGTILQKSSTSLRISGKLYFGKRQHGMVPTEIAEMQTKQGKNIRPAVW